MWRLPQVPQSFRELYEAGRFDYWTAPYRSLTDADRERLIRERMPRVLWWSTIEWDRTLDEILAPQSHKLLRPGLIPFANSGYGQEYCWYPRWSDGDAEPPVVFASPDDSESGLFARNFIECACRCFVREHAREHAYWNEDDSVHSREMLWIAHLEILRPYLTPELATLLDADGQVPSSEACASIDAEIATRVGERKLITAMPAVQYAEPRVMTAFHVNAYEKSVAFYRDLVEGEGWIELREQLREAEANLEDAASCFAEGKS